MTAGSTSDDEATPAEEDAAYWRYRVRTSRALLAIAAALVVMFVFRQPLKWGDGVAATGLYHGAHVALAIAALVAYVSHGRMAERRGFIAGRFRRAPPREPPKR